MNRVRQQLASMLQVQRGQDGFTADLRVKSSLSILPDHFPQAPVVPGMCLVQAVLMAAEAQTGRRLRLRKLANAKFMAPAMPEMPIAMAGTVTTVDSSIQVKASLTSDGKRLAQIVLVAEAVEAPE